MYFLNSKSKFYSLKYLFTQSYEITESSCQTLRTHKDSNYF